MTVRKPTFFERWGLIALLVVAMVYGYLEFLQKPLIEDYAAVVKKNNTVVQSINALNEEPQAPGAYKVKIADMQSELGTLRAELEDLKREVLTPKEQLEETVMLVSEVAANNYMRVGSIVPLQDNVNLFASLQKDQKVLQRTLYQTKLTGDFVSFYRFVSELGDLGHMVNISQVTVVGRDEDGHIDIEMVLII